MKKVFFLLGLFFINTAMANVISTDEYNKCKIMTESNEKLDCYESLHSGKKTVNKDKSEWNISQEKSEIDDSQTIILRVEAERSIYTDLLGRYTPVLGIVCQNNKTELYINWNAYLGIDSTKVITRVDKEKKNNKWWNISTNNKASFYPTDGKIAFIKSLLGKNKLFVQVTPYGENTINTAFNITGLSDEIAPLRKTCGW
ncbi:type VI secretion system-associated protein TagO [Xenorhabdus siamensis]|uniref:type VI secretion system-associated protein TagO n=1 Tax=Xenorhabdus siamensis TaxID=3136254 RepID=UPI0030F4521B